MTPTKATLSSGHVRWLSPETTTFFEGTFSLLHCAVKGDALYRGVFAVRLFPVSYPEQYTSLRYTAEDDKVLEVGVILRLGDFPAEAVRLIRDSLARHYYEQRITDIHEVTCDYGLLFFDVQTPRGRESFIMRWQQDRAEDYGEAGKVMLDVYDNRYVIPDVGQLTLAAQRRLIKYVYW